MTFPELDKKFDKIVKDLTGSFNAEIMVKIGISALTFIKQRVQETGVDAHGKKFAPYSTKDTLIGSTSFLQKAAGDKLLGSKEKRKKLEWRTVNGHRLAILEGGYKKIRELQGRQTDHVDFSVTNNMWNDINIISKAGEHQKGTVIIGAKQDKEKKKLAGNTKRKGDILDLNQKEIDDLKLTYNLGVLNIFKENGL
jgi:hypothetical protein